MHYEELNIPANTDLSTRMSEKKFFSTNYSEIFFNKTVYIFTCSCHVKALGSYHVQ